MPGRSGIHRIMPVLYFSCHSSCMALVARYQRARDRLGTEIRLRLGHRPSTGLGDDAIAERRASLVKRGDQSSSSSWSEGLDSLDGFQHHHISITCSIEFFRNSPSPTAQRILSQSLISPVPTRYVAPNRTQSNRWSASAKAFAAAKARRRKGGQMMTSAIKIVVFISCRPSCALCSARL